MGIDPYHSLYSNDYCRDGLVKEPRTSQASAGGNLIHQDVTASHQCLPYCVPLVKELSSAFEPKA